MRRRLALLALLVATTTTACGTSPHTVPDAQSLQIGRQLAAQILPAPSGYVIDPDPGINGRITPEAFKAVGGDGDAAAAGFVGGYKGTYLSPPTHEGIVVTLLQFDSPADATRYRDATATGTLSAYAPTSAAVADPAGGRRYDGTRSYQGDWAHAVVAVKGRTYMSLVYLATGPGAAPIEFASWGRQQYAKLV